VVPLSDGDHDQRADANEREAGNACVSLLSWRRWLGISEPSDAVGNKRGWPGRDREQRADDREPNADEHRYFSMLTARAITSATVMTDTIECSIIVSFAQRESGITSVGLNAVALVNDTYR
jgi:hypothetical protein